VLENGLLVALGLLVTLAKVPWRWKLWIVSHPLAMDALIFIALTALHWGTYSGVMVATIGALFCSLTLAGAKKVIGHTKDNRYYPGWIDAISKLRKENKS
jgi:hypothetical protein